MADFERQGLDGILSGEAPRTPEAPPEDASPDPSTRPMAEGKIEPLDRPRRADGTFKSKDEIAAEQEKAPPAEAKPEPANVEATPAAPKPETAPAAAPAQPPMDPQVKAFLAAAQDERRKRQELERQLAEIRQQLPKPEQPQGKTFWDDPEGFLKERLTSMEQARDQSALQVRMQTADMLARSKYPDYEEKLHVFEELAQTVPGLAQQLVAAEHPGEFAYTTAKNHMMIREAGGVEALVEKRVAAERVRIEGELKAKAEELAKSKAALPGTLSDIKGAASNQQRAEWTGPSSLDDVLARPKKK